MNSKLKRVLAGVMATAIVGATPLLSASPAAAATLAGPATVKTAGGGADLNAGDANDSWTLRLPAGAACAADGNNGGRWHTYMIPGSQNPVTDLAFAGNGGLVGASTGSGGTGTFRNNLYTTTNVPVRGQAPNLGDAAVINIPNMSYNVWTAGQIPSGVYNVGIACVDLDLASAIDNLWNQRITVTYPGGDAAGAQITWAVGEAPAAPVLTTVTPSDSTLTAAFTHAASTPSSTYTATATPQAADSDCAAATSVTTAPPVSATTPIAINGLTNSCTYDVVVTASNGVGAPAVSNTVSGTPNPARPAVTGLTVVPNVGGASISWSYAGPAATGYSVTVQTVGPPPVAAGTVTVAAFPATTATVSGLTAGTLYTATVTPTYASPPAGTSATSANFTPNSAQTIQQQLEVVRPVGNLVLTQVCGEYGELLADTAGTPGFPAGSPLVAAAPAVSVGSGGAPFLNWDNTLATGAEGTNPDPDRGEYPYPVDANEVPNPSYPTHCGVDLGKGKFVTSGAGAGQFFAASGRLNQVTVVDTRDTDPGWTVNGTMGTFTGPSGSFSGNHLGWNPVLTSDTPGFDHDLNAGTPDYSQAAAAGSVVNPRDVAAGMTTGRALGTAPASSGLGIAEYDARLKLLIPVTARNGLYEGTLTFTVA